MADFYPVLISPVVAGEHWSSKAKAGSKRGERGAIGGDQSQPSQSHSASQSQSQSQSQSEDRRQRQQTAQSHRQKSSSSGGSESRRRQPFGPIPTQTQTQTQLTSDRRPPRSSSSSQRPAPCPHRLSNAIALPQTQAKGRPHPALPGPHRPYTGIHMFTTPAPAAPTELSATTVSSASPPSRPSRLRDLSASLRNYTHSLHSHAHAAAIPGGSSSRANARTPATPVGSPQTPKRPGRPRSATATGNTTTSAGSATATATASSSSQNSRSVTPASARSEHHPTLSRTYTAPEPSSLTSLPSGPSPLQSTTSTMTRTRAETATPQLTVRNQAGPTPASPMNPPNPSLESPDGADNHPNKHLPSIRFIPHQDPRAPRPSLQFPTITRTLPDENSVIRVGRYSERDNLPDIPPNVPSAAAVGFKSKVVSRKHCELWCKDSQWYIKDVKSSSGTFLNHIRLSQPNIESKPFPLKDGDIIQLGIDFRGGEEMIFRCVKIRIECNRGWQQGLNTFNKQTHQRLRNLAKTKKENDAASTHTSECSICLMSIAPCQSLFVAPCSHVWHYKCIRPILNGPTWPNFLCPNCRAVADLEADVEDPGEFEEWDEDASNMNGESQANGDGPKEDKHVTPRASVAPLANGSESSAQANGQINLTDLEAALSTINIAESLNGIANQPAPAPSTPQRFITPAASSSVTQPVTINISAANHEHSGLSPLFHHERNGLSPERAPDCPMTPRNDAGPFVLDGSAGRGSGSRTRDDSPASEGTEAPSLPPIQMG